MTTSTSPPLTPIKSPAQPAADPVQDRSPELAAELDRLETTELQERDRQREAELARLRDLARFD